MASALAALALPFFLASCSGGGDKGVAVTGVALDKQTLTLPEGGTETLPHTVQPQDAGNKAVAWTSNNPGVATVSAGLVTAVSGGEATITVRTDDGGKTATCAVTVTTQVSGVALDAREMALLVGGQAGRLEATVAPANATDRAVSWTSSDPATAGVAGDGLGATVTALDNGTTTITVTTADGSKKATCLVTVTTPVASVGLDRAELVLNPGGSSTLTATVLPEKASDKTVIWSSSDPGVATVEGGLVTAVALGAATITAAAADGGHAAACGVSVEKVPSIVHKDRATVAGGRDYSLAVKADGSLWAWGNNEYGRLGDGTVTDRFAGPVRVGEDTDWASVSAGGYHSLAVKADGSLWGWGGNWQGQVGDGTGAERPAGPVRVGEDSDWAGASAGLYHSAAVKTDGSLSAWGWNIYGQLGIGDATVRLYAPAQIGADSDWVAVSAGEYHTLALKEDGGLWAWGYNDFGQLGDDTSDNKNAPVKVGSNTVAAQTGFYHSVALDVDGRLWAWGSNSDCQLGDGTSTDRRVPVRVGADTDWAAVSVGDSHAVALRSDGSLWGWGGNCGGQVGDGSRSGRHTPVSVGGGFKVPTE
jgi:uncharacterized protein YjdB/alpha-tubulin suppressor-like RCC1 family protein